MNGGKNPIKDGDYLLLERITPESAGSIPGPACYGTGSQLATVTDANLVLGRLNPLRALGDRIHLNAADARKAQAEKDVKEMEAALKAAGKTAEFVIYPGAPHAFNADYRESYRADAAKDGWARCVAWFNTYLKS